MNDGLKIEHRNQIISAIAANDRVERAVLFGSRALGTHSATSDIDIALFGKNLTMTDQARIAIAVDALPMAQTADLVRYDTIQNPALQQHIQKHGVVLFERAPVMRKA